MNPETVKRLEAYLKRTLNPGLTLAARPRVMDSVEVTLGGEHLGLGYLIADEGEPHLLHLWEREVVGLLQAVAGRRVVVEQQVQELAEGLRVVPDQEVNVGPREFAVEFVERGDTLV
ncbi:MAG: DUF3126 family protein, partial [Hyphomonadaceae bacterium]